MSGDSYSDHVRSLVKALTAIPDYDPTRSESENWERGIPIGEAWWLFAPEDQKERYRASTDLRRAAWIAVEFRMDCQEAVLDSRLIAVGIPASRCPNAAIARIAPMYFRPKASVIDWEKGALEGLGERFEGIHILKPLASGTFVRQSPNGNAPQLRDKRGRKPLAPLLGKAARQIAATDPLFRDRPQEKQIALIQAEAATLDRARFTGTAEPGRSTVARYIKTQSGLGWPDLADPENP